MKTIFSAKALHIVLALIMVSSFSLPGPASGRRDPLTSDEVDKLREATQDPDIRLHLLVTFANARLQSALQLKTSTKPPEDRAHQIHALLEDFNAIVEELEDNLDMYTRQRAVFKKAMKEIVPAYADWQSKLRGLKPAGTETGTATAEYRQFEFVLTTSLETVDAGADSARTLNEQQQKLAEDVKHRKKEESKR